MDPNDYWQENKRFVSGVGGGAVVFLVAYMIVSSFYDDDIRGKNRTIAKRQSDLKQAMFSAADLAEAKAENDELIEAVDKLIAATRFEPRAEFVLDPASGAANTQYLRALSRVREDLLTRANRANLQVDAALGMPALSPTREPEIERYLEALDLVETVVDLSIDARAQRIDRIHVKLDPALTSRDGLGDVERTRISFDITGTSLALTRLLTWTQRPHDAVGGRVLHIDSVELAPSRSKDEEVHLELTLVIARLSERVLSRDFGEDV